MIDPVQRDFISSKPNSSFARIVAFADLWLSPGLINFSDFFLSLPCGGLQVRAS